MQNAEDRIGNRAGDRAEDKYIRGKRARWMKDWQDERRMKWDKGMIIHIRNRVAKAQVRSKARWDFRRKIGLEQGVSPKRVALTGKMVDGEATYIIRPSKKSKYENN